MKYRDPFEFTPFARLLFSANRLPASNDASQAFFDRWLIVPFASRFRGTRGEIPRRILFLGAASFLAACLEEHTVASPDAVILQGGLA
jgi:phage/plasmid-associated DNA primase